MQQPATVVPMVTTTQLSPVNQQRMTRLRNLGWAELGMGIVNIVISIISFITFLPTLVQWQIPNGIMIIIAASLASCCSPANLCRLRAHMVLAIIACLGEVAIFGYSAAIAAQLGSYGYSRLNALLIVSALVSLVNFGLLLWSSIVSGQLGCGCCGSEMGQQPAQVVYVQQAQQPGMVPMQQGMVPMQQGMVPMQQGMVPMQQGMVPMQQGVVQQQSDLPPKY